MKRNQKILVLTTMGGLIWLLHSYFCDWAAKTGPRGLIPGLLAARSVETRTLDFAFGVILPVVLGAAAAFLYLGWKPLLGKSPREGRWLAAFMLAGATILIGIALSVEQGRFGGRGSVFVYVGGLILFLLLLFATGDFSDEVPTGDDAKKRS